MWPHRWVVRCLIYLKVAQIAFFHFLFCDKLSLPNILHTHTIRYKLVCACVWENWSSPHRPPLPPPLRSPPAAAPELDQRRERGSCRCLRTETNIETLKTLFSSQISSQFKDNVSACAPFPVWVSPATPSRWRCPTEQQSELFPAKTNTH